MAPKRAAAREASLLLSKLSSQEDSGSSTAASKGVRHRKIAAKRSSRGKTGITHSPITKFLRRTSKRVKRQRSQRLSDSTLFFSAEKKSSSSSGSMTKEKKDKSSTKEKKDKSSTNAKKLKKGKKASGVKKGRKGSAIKSSTKNDVDPEAQPEAQSDLIVGDIWHPKQRNDLSMSLPPNHKRLLERAGIGHWVEYATDLHYFYQAKLKSTRRSILIASAKKPYVSSTKKVKKMIALHRHIATVRRKYVTERDGWSSWLLDGYFRGFSSIWTMEMTLRARDRHVEPIVRHLVQDLKFTGPHSILSAISAPDRSYEEAVAYLAGHVGTCINFRKASAIVALAVLTIMMDKVPDTYPEIVSLPGAGPKCAYEALKEGFGRHDDGVGCDIHMCRMFGILGFADPVTYYQSFDKKQGKYVTKEKYNHDLTSSQLMSWLPKEYWSEMNYVYAGLGQLLQKSDPILRAAIRNDLMNVPEPWMAYKLKDIIELPQYARVARRA